MLVKQIRVESLGNSSYIVCSEEQKTCVVDPVRDIDIYTREAEALGYRILYSLETHVHNDFVSGSRELTARVGTLVCASAAGGLVFEHRPMSPGDRLEFGEVSLEVMATPGHTPAHISFLATDGSKAGGPHAIFSGGALMVGGVARSDLLGRDVAPFLSRWFYRTIKNELQRLSDDVDVYPTHGAGSFCLATPSSSEATVSTIGQERTSNPFFQAANESEFVELSLSNLPAFPAYYRRMAAINVRGPRILGELPRLYPLAPSEVWVRTQRDSVAVDTRGPDAFGTGHIPRSYSVPFGTSFGTWVGWLVDEGTPIVFVWDDEAIKDEIVRHLVRIGYDALEGYVGGGMEAWTDARLPTSTTSHVTPAELDNKMRSDEAPVPIDVRFGHEWRLGHVPTARHIELGDLPDVADALARDASYAMLAAAGVRASTAASVLARAGFDDVAIVAGGTTAWAGAGQETVRQGGRVKTRGGNQ